MEGIERLGTPPIVQAAIGRPLDPAWKEHFAEVTRRLLPSSSELRMRKIPGVVYVPGDRLAGKPKLETDDEDDRQIRIQRYARSIVTSLSDQDKLDKEAAMSTIDVCLHRPRSVGFKNSSASNATMVIEVNDTPSAPHDGYSYQIEAERDAFFDKFLIDYLMVSERQHPKYYLAIGRISGLTPPESVKQIGRVLREPIPLLGISALNFALES